MPFIDDSVDEPTPKNVSLSAKYRRSFAYVTVKDRLPVILTHVIDHLSREKEQIITEYGEAAKEDLKTVIGLFSKLKNELQTNKPLQLLTSTGADVGKWNAFYEERMAIEGSEPRWYASPWLYTECYMYRRFRECFELSESLQMFDPFRKQKEEAASSNIISMSLLADHLLQTMKRVNELNSDEKRRELLKLIQVNLWGNRCDLSISSGSNLVLSENPLDKVDELQENVLVDDSACIWNALSDSSNRDETIIDIVLDNAGYELFTDMCLADVLISFSLASHVRFRTKALPWFVSDVLIPDFRWFLSEMGKHLPVLASRWQSHLDMGRWSVKADDFWTLPHDYSRMQEVDPELYETLSQATLIIFKGDLNYRKLTGDINWDPTESFFTALRGFNPTKLVALRTIKADVVCGLPSGRAEVVAARSSDWLVSGQYALVQFCS